MAAASAVGLLLGGISVVLSPPATLPDAAYEAQWGTTAGRAADTAAAAARARAGVGDAPEGGGGNLAPLTLPLAPGPRSGPEPEPGPEVLVLPRLGPGPGGLGEPPMRRRAAAWSCRRQSWRGMWCGGGGIT